VSQLVLDGCAGIVLPPDWKDGRGSWCTPALYAAAVGPFRVDPFSNERSLIRSNYACWLERGDDGFGGERRHHPGTFRYDGSFYQATEAWTVWLQPPYDIVLDAIAHYAHTRFAALLRLDTSTAWFEILYDLCDVIMVPRRDRLEFIPPPGIAASSNPFPHGLYYRHAEDVPQAVKALCFEWRTK
jgi:hypothetical protein